MTDLERARAHLVWSRQKLADARILLNNGFPRFGMSLYENDFLAALAWVRVEQEKK